METRVPSGTINVLARTLPTGRAARAARVVSPICIAGAGQRRPLVSRPDSTFSSPRLS